MLIAADARETVLNLLPKAGTGMEIGVWRGDFSARILKVAQPKVLHLVDPWREDDTGDNRNALYGSNNITQSQIDRIFESVKARFSDHIASNRVLVHRAASSETFARFADDMFDFVYIDGDHKFESVLADLTNAFRVVKAGGLICGDDYSLNHWWGDGVVRALHEFLAAHAVTLHFVISSQFVLRKLTAQKPS